MFQIHLTRAHFHQLVIAAANTGGSHNDDGPVIDETGWRTRFDGGSRWTIPSEFVALYGEGSEWGQKGWMLNHDGSPMEPWEPFLFALVQWGEAQNCRQFLRRRGFSATTPLARDGLDLIESAATSSRKWEHMAEEDVPEHVRRILEKAIRTVEGLFGQGGDFFEEV